MLELQCITGVITGNKILLASCLDIYLETKLPAGKNYTACPFLNCPLSGAATVAIRGVWQMIPCLVQNAIWRQLFPTLEKVHDCLKHTKPSILGPLFPKLLVHNSTPDHCLLFFPFTCIFCMSLLQKWGRGGAAG